MTGRIRCRLLVRMLLLYAAGYGTAQGEPPTSTEIRGAVNDGIHASVELYREFLALPNDALYPADIEALLVWMQQAFSERHFVVRRIPTAGSPVL